MRRASLGGAVLAAGATGIAACGSCGSRGDAGSRAADAAPSSITSVVAERLPRCRRDAERLALPGEDVVVGDVAVGPGGLLVGLVRGEGGKRVASVLRASLDLKTSKLVDVGPSLGDDPPPSPRWNGATAAWVGFLGRTAIDGGPKLRTLSLAKLEGDGGLGRVESTVTQQADESTAYDVAWTDGGAGLAAWDEDAPLKDDGGAWLTAYGARGFVKVQPLGDPAARPKVVSPETADAESPKLLARPGGFWLAWLAQRVEEESHGIEGPGEARAFRWVDVIMLDARGEPSGTVRRISSEKGRAVGFELARGGGSGDDLAVLVEDETERAEGAGSKITRYVLRAGRVEESAMVLDGGVGHGLVELVPVAPAESARWLAFTDTAEHAHLASLGAGLVAQAPPSLEPALDGARVVAAIAPDVVYAVASDPRPELRKLVCH